MSKRKRLGYALLIVSCIAIAVLPVVPFLSIAVTEKAAWAGGLFVFAELTWWLAMPLLGKEILQWSQRCWQWVKIQWRKPSDANGTEQKYSSAKTFLDRES